MPGLLDRCQVLKNMFDSRTSPSLTGESVPLHSNINLSYAESLYEMVRRVQPAVVVEVGMAFGVSSLAILTALRDGGRGRLISIDPMQTSEWNGCGRAAVIRAGFGDLHELIEDYDYHALPRLLASGVTCAFAYIDGWHTFDYALLNWWYLDKMLAVNGVVGFNDCGWPAVDKVIRFVRSHRKYSEIDAGLPIEYVGLGGRQELLRLLTFGRKQQSHRQAQDRYFRKEEDWEPQWDFFAPF
jgi:predicted O-methyltransferase YrrM